MRKVSLSLFLIILAAATALSQQPTVEQGKPAELKGITKVYLSARDNNARQSIVKEIKKSLPDLTFTDRPEEAEVWLVFNIERGNVSNADPASGLTSSSVPLSLRNETVATGSIIKPIAKNRVRKLLDFKDSSETALAGKLGTNFAREFVKLYRKANADAKRE